MNTASITQHHPVPFAAAAAAIAAAAVVGIGSMVVSHETAPPDTTGSSATHQQGPGFGRSFYDRRTTGGTVMVGP